MFSKVLGQDKEGDHGGVTVCILITNPIPNEILSTPSQYVGGISIHRSPSRDP